MLRLDSGGTGIVLSIMSIASAATDAVILRLSFIMPRVVKCDLHCKIGSGHRYKLPTKAASVRPERRATAKGPAKRCPRTHIRTYRNVRSLHGHPVSGTGYSIGANPGSTSIFNPSLDRRDSTGQHVYSIHSPLRQSPYCNDRFVDSTVIMP